jgi:hypothetical protein
MPLHELPPGSHPRSPFAVHPARVLFGCIFGGIGLIFACVGVGMLWQYWRAARWPTAPGVILTSRVDSQRGSKGGTTYACLVTYRFQANGREYTGDKLEPMTVYSSGSAAREDNAAYAAGMECTVHYDPDDPAGNSCLRPRAGVFQWIFFGIGSLFALVGFIALVAGWWGRGGPIGST